MSKLEQQKDIRVLYVMQDSALVRQKTWSFTE